jgi:hypothetical protein
MALLVDSECGVAGSRSVKILQQALQCPLK